MKLKIIHKLFLSILLTMAITVVLMVMLMQASLDRGFLNYINQSERVQLDSVVNRLRDHYTESGSWDFVKDEVLWRVLTSGEAGPRFKPRKEKLSHKLRNQPGKGPPPKPEEGPINIGHRIILIDAQSKHLAGRPIQGNESVRRDIVLNDTVIGTILVTPLKNLESDLHKEFIRQQDTATYLIALIAFLLSALAAILTARHFQKPIKRLTLATSDLRQGNFEIRLKNDRNDELGDLARDFNNLSERLAENERSRRQWVTDISHELRTPIAILRGEIEALQDGVRMWNASQAESLKGEVLRLSKLVDDLYQLSLADAGKLNFFMEVFDITKVIDETSDKFRATFQNHEIELTPSNLKSPILIEADESRIIQLLSNLYENSIRYTDPGGKVTIRLVKNNSHIVIDIDDSFPGVPDEALEKLFDRLYRVEYSRSRSSGGTGIGLSLCKKIAIGHGGIISAHHSSLGGLNIQLSLPIKQ